MKRLKAFPTTVWIIFVLLASAIVLWPLFRPGFFISDDGEWMIIRLTAFYQSLAEGQFPVRFLGRLNHSYGYPVANFLYPGFLYIGSLFHRIGFSFVDSVKVLLIGSVMGAAVLVFLGLRKAYKSFSSFMGTLGFLFMPYLLFDLYTRGSIGEVLALFAAALLWFSIRTRRAWILPWATALLLVSHNSLALLFLLIAIGQLLAEHLLFKYGKALLLGIGIATFFWFPAIFERQYVFFDAVNVSQPSRYFIDAPIVYLLNFVPIVAGIILVTTKKKREDVQLLRFSLVTLFVGTLLATPISGALWQQQILAKLFQFPYRFLSIGAIAGPLLIAAALEIIKKQHQVLLCLLFAVTWLIPWWMSTQAVKPVQREEGYYTTNEGTTTVANEYMPRWVIEPPKRRAVRPVEFFAGKGIVDVAKHSTQKIQASITAEEQSVIEINTIYYPGWGALVDGAPARIDYQNSRGIMRIAVPAGQHHLSAEFRETAPRFLADIISLLAGAAATVYSIRQLAKTNIKKSV